MGNQQNHDNRVRLYLTTQKPLIYAGQYLQGTAHVQVLEDTPYLSINLSIVGKEKVQWAQVYQKMLLSHKNQIETYKQELILEEFQNGLKKGQYSFPFNILIPSSLPASMKIDENNYIAYYLTLYLPAYNSQSSKQAFDLFLHIREPLRSIFKTDTQGTAVSKCCGCFYNQQSGLFHIQVDRNQIHYTDQFKVRVVVDNKKGGFSFQRIALTLMRRLIKVSDSGGVKIVDEQVGVFYKSKDPLSKGRKKKFEIDLNLPARILEYTAIGNIISRYYFICLIGEVGYCYNDTRIEKHMVLNNQVPPEDWQKMKQVKHLNWNPQIKPAISFVTLKPYIYNPASQIEPLNQKGNVLASTIMNMQMSANNLYRTE